mmetsp:Transcript_96814/g.312076  ORF Transcript_96814/g.312076 Transcript_96814/m.312076 type:complete len:238 (+) Transcript_96814:766-1479(+)
MVLLDVLCEGEAIANLGADRTLGLIEELEEARGALVHRVIRVHGQRVAHVVVCALLCALRRLAHHAEVRRADWVLVHFANELEDELLDRFAREIALKLLRSPDTLDQADARTNHGLQKLDLLLLAGHQGRGLEGGHLDVTLPRHALAVQLAQHGAGALDLRSRDGTGIEGFAHERGESMKPMRLECLRVLAPGGDVISDLHSAATLDGRHLADNVFLQVPHIRRRGPVEVRPAVGGV